MKGSLYPLSITYLNLSGNLTFPSTYTVSLVCAFPLAYADENAAFQYARKLLAWAEVTTGYLYNMNEPPKLKMKDERWLSIIKSRYKARTSIYHLPIVFLMKYLI
jgi:hypothetical protein